MKRHEVTHTGREKPHKCQYCNKTFSRIDHKKQHELTHTGEKPHKCTYCNKSFAYLATKDRHELVHTGTGKPHHCSYCYKGFNRIDHKKQHELTHTGEKPHKCSYCDKRFAHLGMKNRHEQIHAGKDKPLQCRYCKKSFSRMDHKKQHELTHTSEKPHKCSHCNERFAYLSAKNRHELTHTGRSDPHQCLYCHKSFVRLDHKKQHELTHTGEKHYTCSYCNKSFAFLGARNRHELTHKERLRNGSVYDEFFPAAVEGEHDERAHFNGNEEDEEGTFSSDYDNNSDYVQPIGPAEPETDKKDDENREVEAPKPERERIRFESMTKEQQVVLEPERMPNEEITKTKGDGDKKKKEKSREDVPPKSVRPKLKCPRCGVFKSNLKYHINSMHHTNSTHDVMTLLDQAKTGGNVDLPTRRERKDKRKEEQPRGPPKVCPCCSFRTRYLGQHMKKMHPGIEMPLHLDMRRRGAKKERERIRFEKTKEQQVVLENMSDAENSKEKGSGDMEKDEKPEEKAAPKSGKPKLKCPRCGVFKSNLKYHINSMHHTNSTHDVTALLDLAKTGGNVDLPTRRERKDKRKEGKPRGPTRLCPCCPYRTRYLHHHMKKKHPGIMPLHMDMRRSGAKKERERLLFEKIAKERQVEKIRDAEINQEAKEKVFCEVPFHGLFHCSS
ncbi:uncharacterized protein [Amphiura filiformis]|uniref:uncharacterized protein n=1 Tax=Amphiura filiformis TaxID=82378 RepID=UPI003B21961B